MACPLWPFHIVIMYILTLCPVWLFCTSMVSAMAEATWNLTFSPPEVDQLVENTELPVQFWSSYSLGEDFDDGKIEVSVMQKEIAGVVRFNGNCTSCPPDVVYLNTSTWKTSEILNLSFALQGKFLGYTKVKVKASTGPKARNPRQLVSEPLSVSVKRLPRIEDKIFIYSIAILMGLNYVNMGCSLNLNAVKSTLTRPVGPAVGMLSQYICMPLISFCLAYAFFTSPALRLGLFTAGCSPGGGASNMWTYLLGGNLNLSITMTFFSNVFAFVMMPVWLFTLGRVIFTDANITIPYASIVSYIVALVVPVGFGVLFQLYIPRVSAFCRRILGPFSIGMIVFIVVFGVYTNLFMFKVFTWEIFIAGLLVPFLGYLFGAVMAKVLNFPFPDITAISIETGVQNTGIAIVVLRLTLPQPSADLTSVVPVALATMTPFPILIALLVMKLKKRLKQKKESILYTLTNQSSSSNEDEMLKIAQSPNGSLGASYINDNVEVVKF